MSIHERIKAAREAKGWSMTELAEKVSEAEGLAKPLTWQTVQQWEKSTAPKRKRLAAVAAVLDLDAATLAGMPTPAPPAPTTSQPQQPLTMRVTESQWALLQDFEILPEDDKQAIRSTMRQKAENVRKIVAAYLDRHGMGGTTSDARIEATYGAPPPSPTGSTRQYSKQNDSGPLLPADQRRSDKAEEGGG